MHSILLLLLCVFHVFIQYHRILAASFVNISVSSASSTSPTFLFFREFRSFPSIPVLSTSTVLKQSIFFLSFFLLHRVPFMISCIWTIAQVFSCAICFFVIFSIGFFFFIRLESFIHTGFLSFSLTVRLNLINSFSKSSYLFCFIALNLKT